MKLTYAATLVIKGNREFTLTLVDAPNLRARVLSKSREAPRHQKIKAMRRDIIKWMETIQDNRSRLPVSSIT